VQQEYIDQKNKLKTEHQNTCQSRPLFETYRPRRVHLGGSKSTVHTGFHAFKDTEDGRIDAVLSFHTTTPEERGKNENRKQGEFHGEEHLVFISV
jgi:hypothetical protein